MSYWRRRTKRVQQAQTPALISLSHSTFVDSIYPHLSVPDILNLHFVCSQVHEAVRKWLPAGYNIEHHFGRYFDNPVSFRVLQAHTGTLVSGSNALQYFERSYYPDSDMDIYVPCRHTYTIAKWLLENGYGFRPSENQLASLQFTTLSVFLETISRRRVTMHHGQPTAAADDYGWSAVEDVLTFTHVSKPDLKVQLIVVDPQSTPVACILYFHSSEPHYSSLRCPWASNPFTALVMNFIAWDKAYSLFPAGTFLNRDCLTFGDVRKDPRLPAIYAKYWARGFKISAIPTIAPSYPKFFQCKYRWINDKHSWVIDLHTEEVRRIATAAGGGHCAETFAGFSLHTEALGEDWKVEIKRNPDRCMYKSGAPAICWEEISSPILENTLVLPFLKGKALFCRLKEWLSTQEEFERLEARVTNPGLDLGTIPNLDEIQGWKFWDQEVLNLVLARVKEIEMFY